MEKRRVLIRKDVLNEEEEEEVSKLEDDIAKICEEDNRKKVVDNFKELDNDGDVDDEDHL